MKKEQIIGMAVRLFSVFLVIYIVRYASNLVPYLTNTTTYKVNPMIILLMMLFPLIAAVLLWTFPLSVAAKLIPGVKATDRPQPLQGHEIELMACTIVGLWVLSTAIPDAFYWATFLYVASTVEHHPDFLPDQIGAVVSTIVELAIGFWLALGSKGLIGVVRRLRYAGG